MWESGNTAETVVLLSRQKPDDTIEIDLDLDELEATSAEPKATYQEIKDYVLKEFGLKVRLSKKNEVRQVSDTTLSLCPKDILKLLPN